MADAILQGVIQI